MRTSDRGLSLIKSFEGLRLQAYQDSVGVWTIGYGATRGVKAGMTITMDQAERMLVNDVQRFEPDLDRLVKVPLSQNQWLRLQPGRGQPGVVDAAKAAEPEGLCGRGRSVPALEQGRREGTPGACEAPCC